MAKFFAIVSPILRAALTLLLVLIAAFMLTRIAYQDPAVMLAPRNATPETIAAVARALHLNDPWYQQLGYFLWRGPEIQGTAVGLMHWPPALGYSFRFQMPVTELILSKAPVTLSLACGALVIWMAISMVTGVLAARYREGFIDRVLALFSYAALSLPTFLSGMLIIFFLFYQLSLHGIDLFPAGGYVAFSEDVWQWLRHLLLPWLTLALAEIGIFQRVIRASMLEVLNHDYIRTARAKGVSEWRVYFDHALKPAMSPVLVLTGMELAAIMGGAIVTEKMFGLDGVGRLAIDAALDGDFPVVIGTTIFAACAFILCNTLVDIIQKAVFSSHVREG
ncbi:MULTISPECIES: ABC transporter permease [Pantoea]|uniref:Peptide/nickel transport system permease protein n=1 Tax=Candidatus Pantoea floridensis TaxID=1938870 RepID=A0A286BZA9_9GAMM|nr:ABC transporter permease [Pantoea floridensis]PIF21990.1 peptide/nickel transport system permease protein [Enterobacteriaceae bacterium JKS000233]SOD39499.1 peptide/nickel transport system permease protein [Pantoea floridensis]